MSTPVQADRSQLREAALMPGEERLRYLAKHPLTLRPVKVVTRAVKSAFLIVSEAATYRQLGVSFQAPFRTGKSTVAEMICANISEVVPNLAVHLTVAESQTTKRNFFGALCESFELITQGTAADRAGRCREAMEAACHAVGGSQLLLIIDEGQNWREQEWEYLRDAGNRILKEGGITLTTVTFGDERIGALRQKLMKLRKDLWARFLMKTNVLSGVRSQEDLHYFLEQCDDAEKYEYPEGSGIAYSEFFLPKAFAAGWRLSDETNLLWEAYERAASSVNKKVIEVPMQWVTDPVVHYLKNRSVDDFEGLKGDAEAWDQSVEASHFVETLI